MSNHETPRSNAVEAPLTGPEMKTLGDLFSYKSTLLYGCPEVARGLIDSPHKIDAAVRSLIPSRDLHAEARGQLEEFYLKFFNYMVDLSRVVIPAQLEGFTRLIIVAQGIGLNEAIATCQENFPCSQFRGDLDREIAQNDRTAEAGGYAIWVRDRIEADEEISDKSAKALGVLQIKGITLLERILLELEYFARTGQHLDIKNWTLCAGSRRSDGGVPCCGLYGGKFRVRWVRVDDRDSLLRAREVVS